MYRSKDSVMVRATIVCMIIFRELLMGKGHETPCTLCVDRSPGKTESFSFPDIEARIAEVSPSPAMMRGFEPFSHPDLVRIVSTLVRAGIKQIGMRTDGGAVSNPQAAQGCIDAGVRVFEIPILSGHAEKSDRMTGTQGLHDAALRGIRQIKTFANTLKVKAFVCAVIPICSHNASHLLDIVQVALNAGVDAIRIECSDDELVDTSLLDTAHTLATRSGVTLFGDGCGAYIEGASLYEVIA
jgi:molybdenum cofactor biosynthesis enzyme MoaA